MNTCKQRFYVRVGTEVLAEFDASSPVFATSAEEADSAPEGALLVDLMSGRTVAERARFGWSLAEEVIDDLVREVEALVDDEAA